jgi:hypothetical protein
MSINFRPQGYDTERQGADDVAPRRMNQRDRLLKHYLSATIGLTDDEAAQEEGLMHTCYWKRCSELRELGYITTLKVAGHVITREGHAGSQRIVCFITEKGREHAQEA